MQRWVFIAAFMGMVAVAGSALAETSALEAAGAVVFQRCKACHSADASRNTFGPNLVGIVGRAAGTLPDFQYSEALRASGRTWSEDSLRKWIADNDAFIPGTRMRHVAIADPAEQDYLIAYLKSLK